MGEQSQMDRIEFLLAAILNAITDEVQPGQCAGCHGDLSETTDADNRHKYQVDPPTRCHSCTALIRAKSRYVDSPERMALTWPRPHITT